MAGMLPGVESARRRRFRGSDSSSSIITSGFGSARTRLSYDTHLKSTSFLQRSMSNQSDQDEKLGGAAREAKERLDGRLRGHRKSEIQRQNNHMEEIGRRPTTTSMVIEDLQIEVFVWKKNGSKKFIWGKMGLNLKSSNQDCINECAVCLDQFKTREKLTRLPCAHLFHYECLLPWIESNARCPCCRTEILGSN